MTVHIYAPRPTMARKVRRKCPTCERRTTLVAFFYEWHGWSVTCLRCGENWADGERLERPFRPKWREDSVRQSREQWKRYVQGGGRMGMEAPVEEIGEGLIALEADDEV